MESDDDRDLIRACLEGAAGSFKRLMERHRRVVEHAVRCALERVGARGDAELADEAFVRTFSSLAEGDMNALRSFEGRSRFATFLVVVARRSALRLAAERRPLATRTAGGAEDASAEPVDPGPDPSERAEREEVRALVRASIGALSTRDALAIRLFYENGAGHREIATILGVPVTHIGQILARAREKLRGRLERSGLAEDPRRVS